MARQCRIAASGLLVFVHVVVGAVLVRDGKVLLGHRRADRAWYPDCWDLIGGHVQDSESPQERVARELQEELGVDLSEELGDPLVRVVDPDGQDGGLDIQIWRVRCWIGDIVNRADDEHDQLAWFAGADLDDLRLAHDRLGAVLIRCLEEASTTTRPSTERR